ncbi:MAG: 50S ribosomal protein L25 [Deltaproteobacteria bacterium]|nr:50S ribosomal protein L25 [Deltaproteobacteria bacterium]
MEKRELNISVRGDLGKNAAGRLRKQESIPGVLYGPHCSPTPVTISPKGLRVALSTAAGLNTLITLQVEGDKSITGKVVMVRDIQANPLDGAWMHADLYEVPLDRKIFVDVPIHIVGKAAGVEKGGILQVVAREIRVECRPMAIPEAFEVDVSALEMGRSLHVKDIQFPEGVRPDVEETSAIVSVVAPISEEELKKMEEGAQAGEIAEPEVTTEKKEKEGEEAVTEEEKKAAAEGAKKAAPEGAKKAAPAEAPKKGGKE